MTEETQSWPDGDEPAVDEGRQEPRDGETIDVGEVEVGEPDTADEPAE